MTSETIKYGQKVTIANKCDYGNYVMGKTGIVVKIHDNGVNVWLNAFPTLSYQENIFFFPYNAIR